MGMLYHRQHLGRRRKTPEVVQIAGLPPQVLQRYEIEIKEGEKVKKCWRLKGVNSTYGLWEYQGDLKILDEVLEWRENLNKKGFTGFLPLSKTKGGKNYVQSGQRAYYLTAWPEGVPFNLQQDRSLGQVVEALSVLHSYHKNWAVKKTAEQTEKAEFVWLKAQQERLTKLLAFYRYLLEKRLANDYERLYVESFEDFYRRGQEAIQKVVLAGCDTEDSCGEDFLVGNFLPENLLETEKGILFWETTYRQKGLSIQDLVLFLKMYLPLKKWDGKMAREMLVRYREKVDLNNQEKQMFLAQFSFPGRYCFYAEQYFKGAEDVNTLSSKLMNYLYEVSGYDYCLEKLESWLLGE